MNLSSYKTSLIGTALLLSLGLANPVLAHEQGGVLTANGGGTAPNNTGAGATDYYQVTCFSDPNTGAGAAADHLFFQIKDSSSDGNLVGMTVIQDGGPASLKAVSTVDPIGSDAVYSQGQQISAGNAVYTVAVWHTGAAVAQNYSFTYHCQTNGGIHTGTSILRVSNQ